MPICNKCQYKSSTLSSCNKGSSPHDNECGDFEPYSKHRTTLDDVLTTFTFLPVWEGLKGVKGKVSRRLTGLLSKLYLLYVSESLVVFKWPYGKFDSRHLSSIKKKLGANHPTVLVLVESKENEYEKYLVLLVEQSRWRYRYTWECSTINLLVSSLAEDLFLVSSLTLFPFWECTHYYPSSNKKNWNFRSSRGENKKFY